MKKTILSVVGLIGLAAGCCTQKEGHWAGVCDCDTRTWGCRTGPAGVDGMILANGIAAPGAPKAETLKEMPKEAAKPMP